MNFTTCLRIILEPEATFLENCAIFLVEFLKNVYGSKGYNETQQNMVVARKIEFLELKTDSSVAEKLIKFTVCD